MYCKSLHKAVEPLVYWIRGDVSQYVMVRLKGENLKKEIETVKNQG